MPLAHPEREFLNRGRRSAVLDLKHPAAVDALLRLADTADVLLEGLRPGVTERLGAGPEVCLRRNPRLVYARMTGWGQDGPLASTVGHDIGYIARAGALHALGRAGGPPQFPANLLGDFGGGGMLMAYGICAALVERATSGQGQVVDAAIVDGVASLLAMPLMFMAQGVWRDERGVNMLDGGVPWYDVYETADGKWMAVGALEPRFYAALLAGLGLTEAPDRGDPGNWPRLRELFTARFAEKTRDEWAAAFAGSEACVEPVLSMREAASDEHLAARQTYLVEDGVVQPAPAPRFSDPFSFLFFFFFIDRPGRASVHPERELLNRGRRSAVLDLKHPRAVDALLRLADTADVLLEGLRPGVTERLGVGPEVCLRRNPRLVYARMTGWGQDGPLASTVGHDIGYIARAGALHALGRADGPPQFPANLLGDFGGGGMLMAYGICAALVERATSGQGQVVDAAIVDGVASLLAMPLMFMAQGVWRDERGVNMLDGGVPWYDVYETADGQWMAVGALEPRFYAALLAGLGLTEAPDRGDPGNWPRLRELFAARFAEKTRDQWAAAFAGSEACVEPVLSMREAASDEHLAARQTYVVQDGVVQPAPAPRFSRTPGELSGPASVPGQHTTEALTDWGLPDAAELIASGAAIQA